MPFIDIVPIGKFEEPSLLPLQQTLSQVFRISTRVRHHPIDLSTVYDPIRNQYHSSALLVQLINGLPGDTLKVLGVTELDLFIPIFTFLFGEAQLNGPGALVSGHRLHNPFYGMPDNQTLFENRLLKESIHELGHTFGLIHCFTLRCVMNTSTYVEEIDQKSASFCRSCEEGIRRWRNEHLTD